MHSLSHFTRVIESFPEGQPDVYLSNGIIGYRIKPNPFLSWEAAVSGFVKQHEEGRFETLAYAPYPFVMDIRLGDGPSLLESPEKVKVKRQTLDKSCGELRSCESFFS